MNFSSPSQQFRLANSTFNIENGYVKEIEELGQNLENQLEKLGYQITIPSFTDWGYAFCTQKEAKQIHVIIEIESLKDATFKLSLKTEKHWFQLFSDFKTPVSNLFEEIKGLSLGMAFEHS